MQCDERRESKRRSRAWVSAILATLLVSAGAADCFGRALDCPDIPKSNPDSSPIEPASQSFRDEDWAVERAAKITEQLKNRATLRRTNVLFVGDSITQFWTTDGQDVWQRSFEDPRSDFRGLDLGFAGDRTENLLFHLLPRACGGDGYLDDPSLNPEIIVLMIGINNTWKTSGLTVERIVAGNMAIIVRIRQLRPRAALIVQSLLPAQTIEHVEQFVVPINQQLRPLVESLGPDVHWLDLYPLFVSQIGAPSSSLFRDGVHPNADGYAVWAPKLVEVLQAIRSKRPATGDRRPAVHTTLSEQRLGRVSEIRRPKIVRRVPIAA